MRARCGALRSACHGMAGELAPGWVARLVCRSGGMGLGGRPDHSAIEEGCTSTTACILANLALKLGRTLEWDHEQGRVRGDEEANALLRRPYRAPWVHPEA